MGKRSETGVYKRLAQCDSILTCYQKQIGGIFRVNLEELLEAALLGLLVRVENWKPEEVQVFIAQIKGALRDRTVHLMEEL